MSQKKVISLDQFKKTQAGNADRIDTRIESDEGLTAAGKAFRSRFAEAIAGMEAEFAVQLAKAKAASEVKVKINTSTALKKALGSPLTAYSDLHREMVAKSVSEAKKRCEAAMKAKFKNAKARPTIESLQKQLSQERAEYAAALSKLASQKMTEYLTNLNKK